MIIFAVFGLYLMPIFGFWFIIALLKAVKKIVEGLPYTSELFWSGLMFALIVWTISSLALSGSN